MMVKKKLWSLNLRYACIQTLEMHTLDDNNYLSIVGFITDELKCSAQISFLNVL